MISLCAGLQPHPRAEGQIQTELVDFFIPGTQPDESGGKDFDSIVSADNCLLCHEIGPPNEVPIYGRWAGSMMAQAARDPLFQACLTIANQDADFAGDFCIRCHSPGGWLEGRSTPPDGSALTGRDLEGVTCNMCHRAVDPDFKLGVSPERDLSILDTLTAAGALPTQPGNGGLVVDPVDVRRGPFDDVPLNLHEGVDIVHSPFHSESELCATCHDVSNPLFTRQSDGSYLLNGLDAVHDSLDKYKMFPLERTYSEWKNSAYANGGVDALGVFGGNHPTGVMVTCQDCHMPDTESYGSGFEDDAGFFIRPDVPAHDFSGGNTWMPGVLADLYPTAVHPGYAADAAARARFMLQNAATLTAAQEDCDLRVRVQNETGHKLPTGYPEGRRMWLSVEFRNEMLEPVAIRGHYDTLTAELTAADTKVYEAQLGPDAVIAAETDLAAGPSFHFALNNRYYKDNRIPPRGFTNAGFEAVQAAPVGAVYADGQFWDDTLFRVPPGATSAVVSLYYQTASKEYITFLRDENRTNDAGDILYQQWELSGMSPPELMRQTIVAGLVAGLPGDADCDGWLNLSDVAELTSCLAGPRQHLLLRCETFDANMDIRVDLCDVADFQKAFTSP